MNAIKTLQVSAFAALISMGVIGSASASVEVGQAAPDFTVSGASGESVKLSDFRGKHVVLEWTNEHCPFVQKHYKDGNMQGLQQSYTDQDVVWMTVFSSAPGKSGHVDQAGAKKFAADFKTHSSKLLLDESGDVGRAYGAKTTPHMYVINPEGKLIYMGGIDDKPSADPADIASSKNYVKAALDEALAGKPVSEANTRPYGCSIKY